MPTPHRSPNYPGYTIEQAVEWARKLWERENRHPTPAASLAKATGSETVSGPARQKIAALRQYGLIDDVGGGNYKISELGITLALHKPSDSEYLQAVRAAAIKPALFAELFPQAKSSDDTLRIHLIKERSFSDEGATRALKVFRQSLAFAKVDEQGYNSTDGKVNGKAKGSKVESLGDGRNAGQRQDPQREREVGGANDVAYSWPLQDAEKVEVTFVGNAGKKPTRRDLEAVIDYLELVKKRTPEATQERHQGERFEES